MSASRSRWPLLVIGASAGVATWSGWVGLGGLTGFGVIHPLPGIADGVTLNTAITLPVGVEAYAVYALSVATSPRGAVSVRARRWAWWSSWAALLLGMGGQVTYHLLSAPEGRGTPWQVVTAVSCLPVVVLGMTSLLWHLASPEAVPAAVPDVRPVVVPIPVPDVPEPRPGRVAALASPRPGRKTSSVPDTRPGRPGPDVSRLVEAGRDVPGRGGRPATWEALWEALRDDPGCTAAEARELRRVLAASR